MLQTNLPAPLIHAIKSVIPEFNGDGNKLLTDYMIDSFDLMTLRSVLEEELRFRYSDSAWVKIRHFSEYLTQAATIPHDLGSSFKLAPDSLKRNYQLNMPQMNVSGLSEYWYLKEIGDMHWKMIASSLDVASDAILDEKGNRLYATFVRIKFSSTHSFFTFRENDPVQFKSELSRFGHFYLSENIVESGPKKIKADLVTSFVARGSGNSDLYKSVPAGEVKVALKNYTEIPSLIEEYHLVRKNEKELIQIDGIEFDLKKKAIYESSYKLDPYHDLNGVGLLYFAAYPHIYDTCERSFMNSQKLETDWAFVAATQSRDIFYLGNSDLNDEIIYRLLDYKRENEVHYFVAELIRKSDKKRVSLSITKKGGNS